MGRCPPGLWGGQGRGGGRGAGCRGPGGGCLSPAQPQQGRLAAALLPGMGREGPADMFTCRLGPVCRGKACRPRVRGTAGPLHAARLRLREQTRLHVSLWLCSTGALGCASASAVLPPWWVGTHVLSLPCCRAHFSARWGTRVLCVGAKRRASDKCQKRKEQRSRWLSPQSWAGQEAGVSLWLGP